MLSIREIQESDIPLLADYWFHSSDQHLIGMGVDLAKMPGRQDFESMLRDQLQKPVESKETYCVIWLLDGQPIGHNNVNNITFGKQANMHLHVWHPANRQSGLGHQFLCQSIPYFFKTLKLEKLYCEPYAHNPAPNNTLRKLGFEFVKTYRTIPGSINFEQEVNQWLLRADQLNQLAGA
ncbi:MAG: GNAT family N-acetyltransferase [Saprospiraceae bacterium]|nr:GNAT family N-acetyltransferase [Saprospiraceae bacterium]